MIDPDITLLQCMMSAAVLPDIARWKAAHPEYRIVSWACREYIPEKDI